jgi:hypothetical protein
MSHEALPEALRPVAYKDERKPRRVLSAVVVWDFEAGMKSSVSEAFQIRAATSRRQKSLLRRRSQIRFLAYCSLDARDVIRGTKRRPTRTFCWD